MIQRRITPAAYVSTGLLMIIILPGKWHLGALADDNALFFGAQLVVWHVVLVFVKKGSKIVPYGPRRYSWDCVGLNGDRHVTYLYPNASSTGIIGTRTLQTRY